MYRELLEKLTVGHRWARLQKPCPEDKIVSAEKYVGFTFSDELKSLLRETNGCGDYYCYRVLPNGKTDDSAIYIWEHELFEARTVAENIEDLIIKYYNSQI